MISCSIYWFWTYLITILLCYNCVQRERERDYCLYIIHYLNVFIFFQLCSSYLLGDSQRFYMHAWNISRLILLTYCFVCYLFQQICILFNQSIKEKISPIPDKQKNIKFTLGRTFIEHYYNTWSIVLNKILI